MTADLATRLRRLLDVMMDCNQINRRVAARVIGDRIDYSYSAVMSLATGALFVHPQREADVIRGLREIEARYRAPLAARAKYDAACARHLEAA